MREDRAAPIIESKANPHEKAPALRLRERAASPFGAGGRMARLVPPAAVRPGESPTDVYLLGHLQPDFDFDAGARLGPGPRRRQTLCRAAKPPPGFAHPHQTGVGGHGPQFCAGVFSVFWSYEVLN